MSVRQAGTVLDGKYEILERLGGGGMGEVYLVRHLHLEERRVIKVLRPEHASDPTAQTRFLRAARTAAQIKHPNVALLHDYSSLEDGSFFIVWEYIEGEEVGERLEREGPLPVEVALEMGIQALRGLEAIHAAGVVHRDLSPDNLMIARDVRGKPQVKIIDLGLAKNLAQPETEVTQAGMFIGKLRYCSPEQAEMVKGVTLDRRSDIYSFSVVFYEMLAGQPPFDSETPHGFVFKRLTEDPIPLAERNPGMVVPAGLDEAVRKGMARDRDDRFSTAVEMIQALDQVRTRLGELATQEIPQVAPDTPAAGASEAPVPAAPKSKSAGSAIRPRQRPTSQLTREDREALLAQIDRAARRSKEVEKLLSAAETSLARGDLEKAKAGAARLEASHPRAAGLEQLQRRIAEAEARVASGRLAREDAAERAAETERMLESYLESRQLNLARLALDSLLELAPDHAGRREFEDRIEKVSDELERQRRAEEALGAGREALARGDLKQARRHLDKVRRDDPSGELSGELTRELSEAKERQAKGARIDDRRAKLEKLLDKGRLKAAESELSTLADLGLSRVTVDLYRGKIEEARRREEDGRRSRKLEERFRQQVEAGEFQGARETAQSLAREVPGSELASELFAEAGRLEEEHRRQQAIEQGARQVEEFLERGEADQARTALAILRRLAPDHPQSKRFAKRLAELGQGP